MKLAGLLSAYFPASTDKHTVNVKFLKNFKSLEKVYFNSLEAQESDDTEEKADH